MKKKNLYNSFRNLLNNVFTPATFPIFSFALINWARSILQSKYLETIFLTIMIFYLFIFYSLISKSVSRHYWLKIIFLRQYFNLIINVLLLIYMLANYQTTNQDNILIEGLKIGIFECVFLQFIYSSLLKFLSILCFSLFVLGRFDLETWDYFFIVFSLILMGAYFNNQLKKEKNSKGNLTKFISDKVEPYDMFNSLLVDSSDLIFAISDKMKIEYSNYAFNSYILSKNLTNESFIKSFQKSSFFKLNEFLTNFDPSEIYQQLFRKCSNPQVKESSLSFKSIFNKIFDSNDSDLFLVFEANIFEEKKDLILILKKKDFAIFKIKRDFLYEQFIKSNIMIENHTMAISFVAHEFRTPLNCIISMLQNLDQSVDNILTNTYIIPAISSSKFLLNLVNDLLDNAQIISGVFKLVRVDFELHQLLENTFEVIRYQALNRGIDLILDFDPIINTINSDPSRIQQIITNLLSKIFFLILKFL